MMPGWIGEKAEKLKPLAPALLFLASFFLYVRGLAPSLSLEDTGEMIACAMVLGNSHPPGHPWHALLGKLFLLLPAGTPGFRISLLSAACAAAAGVAAFRMVAGVLCPDGRRPSWLAIGAGVLAAAAFGVSRAVWWQATAAEKYSVAIAAVAWSALALWRSAAGGRAGWLFLGSSLAGLTLGLHFIGLYLLPALGWAVWRRRSPRAAVLALAMFSLPLGGKALYHPVRAVADPAVNWGVPAKAGLLADYLGGRRYFARNLMRDHSAGNLAFLAFQHLIVLPWRGIGILALASLLGCWAAWHGAGGRAPPDLVVTALLFGANVGTGIIYQNPEIERYYLPALWALAVMAGLGAGWLALRWRAALAAAAVAVLVQIPGAGGFAARDRGLMGADHVRNMLGGVPAPAVIVAWGDPWLFPLWHAQVVDRAPAAAGIVPAETLVFGTAERAAARFGGVSGELAAYQEGAAQLWAMAKACAPAPVYVTHGVRPGMIPSRGASWSGALIRITGPEKPFGVDADPARRLKRLRLRAFFAPRGVFEDVLVRFYALAFHAQGRILVRAGDAAGAEAFARAGLRLQPLLPELHELLGQAHRSSGRSREAMLAWERALDLTGGMYFDPLVGMAELARVSDPESEIEYWRMAAVLAVGAKHALVVAGDGLQGRGEAAPAVRSYRKAVARGYLGRGAIYFNEGKLEQAERAWSTALEMDPDLSQAMHNLGTVAASEERFADAARWYAKALELSPGSPDLKVNLDRAREAIPAQEKLSEAWRRHAADPGNAGKLVDLGNICWYLGRARVAESFYRRALARDPGSARALGNLGSALVHQGRVEEAVEVYHRVIEANPRYAGAMTNLAAVYQGQGDRARALKWARKALEMDSGDEQAGRMVEELEGK